MNNIPSVVNIALKAPLSGPLVAIEQVPDPVFAEKMVGDGISIDPVDQCLLAPCDGKIVHLHRAGHAITLETHAGLEVMMHIGLETVGLKGVGFFPKVAVGDQVASGDTLIEFDADYIATSAKSLLTQIVITNSDKVQTFFSPSGFVSAGQDVILELTLAGADKAATNAVQTTPSESRIKSEPIVVLNPTGLHARPSATLAGSAKQFESTIHLHKGEAKANAKSLVSIMGLEVDCGDQVSLVANGPDAGDAIATLTRLIKEGLGEECEPLFAPEGAVVSEANSGAIGVVPTAIAPRPENPDLLQGVTASPGLAVGKVFQLRRDDIEVPENAADSRRENRELDKAFASANSQLHALQQQMEDEDKAEIFSAHQELLQDPELVDAARVLISEGKSAAYAWKRSYTAQAAQLANLKNELLAARANDLRDVGRRVLQLLMGLETEAQELPANTILIAEDLTPSDTANLDRTRVLGFCTMTGGSSSHVAILARSMGIPAVAGIEARALDVPNGAPVILDAAKGTLRLNPSDEEVLTLKERQQRLAAKRKADLSQAGKPAITRDGHRTEVAANITGVEDAQQAVILGTEGVGLLRSEFLFMNRVAAPTEEEQFDSYSQVAKSLGAERPLIIRTLDVGGDKPLSYLPIAQEENPFLGLRGIRVLLQCQDIFRIQLRAILRASTVGNVKVMFPMVTTLCELRAAKAILEEERISLGIAPIPVGIMVEVPTTAVMAEQFAKEVDFFSVGTNDLTQYTLAIDRGHPQLAAQADGLNPGVLQLIACTVAGAHKYGKWVGVCGGIASDPQAVPILLGIGVDELSVSVPNLPEVKAQIRELALSDCKRLAKKALQLDTAAEVRTLVPDPFAENLADSEKVA